MADPNVLMNAPVVPIEMAWEGYEIWPCHDCLPWHIEVLKDAETGEPRVIEWHAVGCPLVREIECHGDLGPQQYCAECGTYNPSEEGE